MWLIRPTYACLDDSLQPCSRAPVTHLRRRREPDGLFTGELTSPIEPRWSAAGLAGQRRLKLHEIQQ